VAFQDELRVLAGAPALRWIDFHQIDWGKRPWWTGRGLPYQLPAGKNPHDAFATFSQFWRLSGLQNGAQFAYGT
jgi:hypothetical protein